MKKVVLNLNLLCSNCEYVKCIFYFEYVEKLTRFRCRHIFISWKYGFKKVIVLRNYNFYWVYQILFWIKVSIHWKKKLIKTNESLKIWKVFPQIRNRISLSSAHNFRRLKPNESLSKERDGDRFLKVKIVCLVWREASVCNLWLHTMTIKSFCCLYIFFL